MGNKKKLSKKSIESYLNTLNELQETARDLGTTTYIWAGLVRDIYRGRLLRRHDDIDCLTVNLLLLKPAFCARLTTAGWQIKELENGDLSAKRNGEKIHMGNVTRENGLIVWTHNGTRGCIKFPAEWLPNEPVDFYGQPVFVVAPEFEYILKSHPELMLRFNSRPKDIEAKEYFEALLRSRGVNIKSLIQRVLSVDNT